MAGDLYSVLGVERQATDADISKAYRALAKKLHPDLNPGDTSAEDRFKSVSAAYAILGDPDKRKRYDAGEIDDAGQERPEQKFYREYAGGRDGARYSSRAGFDDFADLSDLFGDTFTRTHRGRPGAFAGADRRYTLSVDFLEAANGAKKRVTLPDGVTLDLAIPAGIESGKTLRMKGKGDPGVGGGPAGDALVEITVLPHDVFTRDGLDIEVELPIGFDLAVLGGKAEVQTISGRVNVTVPPGANTGQTLRLRGRGIEDTRSGRTGDQFVRLKIMLPERIDDDLKAFAREWREKHGPQARKTGAEQG